MIRKKFLIMFNEVGIGNVYFSLHSISRKKMDQTVHDTITVGMLVLALQGGWVEAQDFLSAA